MRKPILANDHINSNTISQVTSQSINKYYFSKYHKYSYTYLLYNNYWNDTMITEQNIKIKKAKKEKGKVKQQNKK